MKVIKLIICSLLLMLMVTVSISSQKVFAATSGNIENADYYTKTDQFIGKDYKHYFFKGDIKKHMYKNLTGWVNKDYNPIVLNYSESVTVEVSFSYTSEISAKVLVKAVELTGSLKTTISKTYSETVVRSYTFTVTQDEPGEYFCIAVNYGEREYKVDHYLQKFKLFGQGEYYYDSTSIIKVPTETYLSKNFKYEIDGQIYEY